MNILVLSDSHGHASFIREAVSRTKPDAVLFAGDGIRDFSDIPLNCPLYAVSGNCDRSFDFEISDSAPLETVLTLDGVRIFLCHGHTLGVKSGLGAALFKAGKSCADVLVFGHTHEPLDMTVGPDTESPYLSAERRMLVCNPGSIGLYPHSFGTLTLQNGHALFSVSSVCDS